MKIVHINAERGIWKVKMRERERSRFRAPSFPPSSAIRMRMWARARGQPRTSNWIPIASGIQFSTRPATWNEQNSNSFHLSEFGRRGRQRAAFTSFRGVGKSRPFPLLFYALEDVPPNVLFARLILRTARNRSFVNVISRHRQISRN